MTKIRKTTYPMIFFLSYSTYKLISFDLLRKYALFFNEKTQDKIIIIMDTSLLVWNLFEEFISENANAKKINDNVSGTFIILIYIFNETWSNFPF